MSNPATGGKEFTGRHMLIIMIAFFSVVIGVNMVMVYFSKVSWTGLVVKNSYVASQTFNKDTAALEKAEGLVMQPRFIYENGNFTVTLLDEQGAPVTTESVTAKLGRPGFEAEDRTLVLNRVTPGTFQAPTMLKSGVWEGRLDADVPGGHWTKFIRVVVKD